MLYKLGIDATAIGDKVLLARSRRENDDAVGIMAYNEDGAILGWLDARDPVTVAVRDGVAYRANMKSKPPYLRGRFWLEIWLPQGSVRWPKAGEENPADMSTYALQKQCRQLKGEAESPRLAILRTELQRRKHAKQEIAE